MTSGGALDANRFSTSGVTAGPDARLADNLIVGLALGFGTDRTDIGQDGTPSTSRDISGTVYASYKPFEAWFIDAMFGSYDIAMGWGVLTRQARLEYRRESDGDFAQSMFFADLGSSLSYTLIQPGSAFDLYTAAVGIGARAGSAVAVDLEYGTTARARSLESQTIRTKLRIAF